MTNQTAPLRQFETDLLPMLAEAAQDMNVAPSRPSVLAPARTWRRIALVASAGLSLALAVPLLSSDPLRGALVIDRRGDSLYVSVKEATADPAAMTNDLRAQGLPANVEVIPVSPSLEGTWVDIVNDNLDADYNDPRISEIFEQIEERPSVLELPADFSTPFTLVVGRPAHPGEIYIVATVDDVEDAHECLELAGLTPAQVEESLSRQGYDAWWYYEHSDMPRTEQLQDVPTDKVVIGAEFHGPTTVIVYTADPGSDHARESQESTRKQSTDSC